MCPPEVRLFVHIKGSVHANHNNSILSTLLLAVSSHEDGFGFIRTAFEISVFCLTATQYNGGILFVAPAAMEK